MKSGFVPPQPGATVPYRCLKCGRDFELERATGLLRGLLQEQVRCPSCKSVRCVCLVRF